jgi:hypothetical protein
VKLTLELLYTLLEGVFEGFWSREVIGEYSDATTKANIRETIHSDLRYDVSG